MKVSHLSENIKSAGFFSPPF